MKLTAKRKLLLIFSFFLTGFFRFAILFIPFKRIARFIGVEGAETPPVLKKEHVNKIRLVRWAVVTASGNTPWKSLCMVQALTAQLLLKIFSIPTTLYLGVAKNESGQLIAHAWLRCGTEIVTGYDTKDNFKAIVWYGNGKEAKK